MKKRLLLGILTICNISLLQAADVDYSTDAFSTDVQIEIVSQSMEESYEDKGKGKAKKQGFVHILRDGRELVEPFSVDLLNESKTLKNILEDTKDYKDFSLERCIGEFLKDSSNDKQIALLIDALKSNRDEKAASFVADLLQPEVEWLMDQSIFWDIASVQAACIKQLVRDLVHLDLDRLPGDYGIMISDACDMRLVREAIAKILPQGCYSELFTAADGEYIKSVAYNGDKTKLLISTDRRIVIWDINTGEERQPFTANSADRLKSVAYNGDETKLLIMTCRRIVIRDINTGEEHQPFTANADEWIYSVAYNDDETKLLICTAGRGIVICDINTGKEHQPFTANADDDISSIAYNDDETKLLICTDRGIVICDINTGKEHQPFTANAHEYIWSVAYNDDETKLFIRTDRRIVIRNINTGKEHQLFTANANESISSAYNDDAKLLIRTGRRIVIKDIETGEVDQLFAANAGEWMRSVAYNGDETKLLICTDRRTVICDLLNGLNIEQKQLLFKALESWQQDKSYRVGNDDELEIYRSLLDKLQKPELFDVEKCRLRERLCINNIPVNIKLPSMASLTASLLRTMFNWGSGSQE